MCIVDNLGQKSKQADEDEEDGVVRLDLKHQPHPKLTTNLP